MFYESDVVKHFDYDGLMVNIFPHATDDGNGGYYDTYCFAILDYDENNIPDNVLFDSEDAENYSFADTIDEAMDNAIDYIDKHF